MQGKSKIKKRNWYNMKGCSKTKTRKNKLFLGGATDLNLAYPSKGPPSTGFNFLNPILVTINELLSGTIDCKFAFIRSCLTLSSSYICFDWNSASTFAPPYIGGLPT